MSEFAFYGAVLRISMFILFCRYAQVSKKNRKYEMNFVYKAENHEKRTKKAELYKI